jgi:hypothetical protein
MSEDGRRTTQRNSDLSHPFSDRVVCPSDRGLAATWFRRDHDTKVT